MRILGRSRDIEVTRADKVWLHSMVKRQKMVVEDLMKFNEIYKGKIDEEIVGSLISIYEMLRDNEESIVYSRDAISCNGVPTRENREARYY